MRTILVVGFEGSDAVAAALQASAGASRVRRFADPAEAAAALAREGGDLLLFVDAGALRLPQAALLAAAVSARADARLVFAFGEEGEATLALRACGGLGLRRPLLLDDLEGVARLAFRRDGPSGEKTDARELAARLALELRGIARALAPSGPAAPASPAATRAASREILDLAGRLDALAGEKGNLRSLPRERVDLRDLLDQRIAALREAGSPPSRVALQGERGAEIEAPRGALERACVEILSFAEALAPADARVEVRVERGDPPRFEIAVPGVPAPDAPAADELDALASTVDGAGDRLRAFRGFCEALGWGLSLTGEPGGRLRVSVLAGSSS